MPTVAALLAVLTLLAGCATSVAGSPRADPAAARDLPASTTPAAGPPTMSPTDTPSSTEGPAGTSTPTPIPPVPPSSDASTPQPPASSTDESAATSDSGDPGGVTVHGVAVADIADALHDDPVYADDDASASVDPDELSALHEQVVAARAGGVNLWVALIGHDVTKLTDVSDAIARRTGGTMIVVSSSRFAVSSKQFSQSQLQDAEDGAASASTAIEAASILVAQFTTMAGRGDAGSSDGAGSSVTAGSGGSGGSLSSFQLADHSIGCIILDDLVRCDLMVDHSYTPPKNPNPKCQGDYGSAMQMRAGHSAAFICVSDTAYDPQAPVLADGDYTEAHGVMCMANGSSVTCLSLSDSHGFFLSPSDFAAY